MAKVSEFAVSDDCPTCISMLRLSRPCLALGALAPLYKIFPLFVDLTLELGFLYIIFSNVLKIKPHHLSSFLF